MASERQQVSLSSSCSWCAWLVGLGDFALVIPELGSCGVETLASFPIATVMRRGVLGSGEACACIG
jgi:hypothetical protein